MTAADLLARSNGEGIRIFSVDGSHTAEATFADINTAAGSLAPGGVVVIGAVISVCLEYQTLLAHPTKDMHQWVSGSA